MEIVYVLVFFLLHWYASLTVQTIFHHRYAAHNQFTMGHITERIFYILTFICQGSSYLSPNAYAILHRIHHAHVDTPKDVHSPKFDKGPIAMMRRTGRIFFAIEKGKANVDVKYKKNLPSWEAFDRFGRSTLSRLMWGIGYVVIYFLIGAPWFMYVLIPLHWLMGPIQGMLVNWLGHTAGYRNYDTKDASRNVVLKGIPIDVPMVGEFFHNNHHKYPSSPNFGTGKWEVDPTYYILKLFSFLRVIKMNQSVAI
jgi:stearoyl-CoA desaturase (Delta-9 desaturase)